MIDYSQSEDFITFTSFYLFGDIFWFKLSGYLLNFTCRRTWPCSQYLSILTYSQNCCAVLHFIIFHMTVNDISITIPVGILCLWGPYYRIMHPSISFFYAKPVNNGPILQLLNATANISIIQGHMYFAINSTNISPFAGRLYQQCDHYPWSLERETVSRDSQDMYYTTIQCLAEKSEKCIWCWISYHIAPNCFSSLCSRR